MDFCRLSLLYCPKFLDVFEKISLYSDTLCIGITTLISSICVLLIRLFQLINGAQVLNVKHKFSAVPCADVSATSIVPLTSMYASL